LKVSGIVRFPAALVNDRIRIVSFDLLSGTSQDDPTTVGYFFLIGQSNPGLSGADPETMQQEDYPRAKTP